MGRHMSGHVCPWWGGYFLDNRVRRLIHNPSEDPWPVRATWGDSHGCGLRYGDVFDRHGPAGWSDWARSLLSTCSRGCWLCWPSERRRHGVGERITCHPCQPNSLNVTEPCDFALCFFSAHEIPDLRHLLEQIHAVLRPTGQLLVVEPRGHVPERQFARMLSEAAEVGFVEREQPPVRWSRAVLWSKRCRNPTSKSAIGSRA